MAVMENTNWGHREGLNVNASSLLQPQPAMFMCPVCSVVLHIPVFSLSLLSYAFLMFLFPVFGAALSEVRPTSGTVPPGRVYRHGEM